MKTLTAILTLIAATASAQAQSATATLQFTGGVGATITINPNGYNSEIAGVESQVIGCSGLTLNTQVTSGSTSFVLNNPNGSCIINPGMGLGFGCPSLGICSQMALVLAAGCTNSGSGLTETTTCPVTQGQFGSTPATLAAGTAVTLTQYGSGEMFLLCGRGYQQLLSFLASSTPAIGLFNASFASSAVASQNATIASASATALSTNAAATSCVPAH